MQHNKLRIRRFPVQEKDEADSGSLSAEAIATELLHDNKRFLSKVAFSQVCVCVFCLLVVCNGEFLTDFELQLSNPLLWWLWNSCCPSISSNVSQVHCDNYVVMTTLNSTVVNSVSYLFGFSVSCWLCALLSSSSELFEAQMLLHVTAC